MANCVHCTPGASGFHVCISCIEKFRSGESRAYSDEYSGPRWRYGYINRPFAIAHQPKGFLIGSYQSDVRAEVGGKCSRHGVLDYPFPLTDDEVYSFEMFLVEVLP